MNDRDLYETPGEALLLLAGLSLFVLAGVLFIVLSRASLLALLPVVVVGQVGLLLAARVETRVARRWYPNLRLWQRVLAIGEARVRKELWRPAALRRAASLVAADPAAALKAIPNDRSWWKGTLFVGLAGIGPTVVVIVMLSRRS